MTQDQARDLALDPTTPGAQLAEIATHRPDLRALVAAHPNAYPALLEWLRGLGDPTVVAAVDARPGTAAPLVPQSHPLPPGGAQQVPAQVSAWSHGGEVHDDPAAVAAPYGAVPGTEGGSVAGFQPGGPSYGAGASVAEIQGAPRRRRKGLVVAGAAAGVAVALGGAALAVNHFILDKVDGSETPRAAFDQLVTGLEKKDALAMLGAMSPAEVSSLSGMLDASLKSAEGSSSATSIKAFTDVLDSLTITTSGVTTTETTLQDGLSKVEVTAGTITLDGDPAKIGDAFVKFWDEAMAQNPELSSLLETYGAGESLDAQSLRGELVTQLEEALPATADFADLARESNPLFVVTVKEDDAWYVSPYLTFGEAAYVSSGSSTPRGTMLGEGKGTGFGSPEAAGDGLVRAILSGDVDAIVASLPLPERRVLSVYLPAGQTFPVPVTVDGTFTTSETKGDRARIVPKGLKIAATDGGPSVTLDGPCLTVSDPTSGKDGRICTDEAPLLSELGLAKLGLVAVSEGGTWFVSPTETIVDGARILSDATLELQKSGKLDDEAWLTERSTALVEYLASQPLFADFASMLGEQAMSGGGLGALGGLGGLGALDGADDTGTGLDGLGAGDEAARTSFLESDLANAGGYVAMFLVESTAEAANYARGIDLDGGASLLAAAGVVPSDGVSITVSELDVSTEAATYCIVATDDTGIAAGRSIDETHVIYESLTCS
ncbi:hypothetical protein [Sanguibacter massiliensis]|uniref:variant leucine-rich repeat-containing protein n=1 Tax=Sanguibacter massiliensis TaxID=1973217 RepID=UPI000C855CD1|nr:hypothetical protein [Sanguibacter massiliensis]